MAALDAEEHGHVEACPVCHRTIKVEATGNSPGDHDPAYHVAQAYHRPMDVSVTRCRRGKPCENTEEVWCESCAKPWPCPTIREYL